jgi:hypothetical protein
MVGMAVGVGDAAKVAVGVSVSVTANALSLLRGKNINRNNAAKMGRNILWGE